MAKSPTVSYQGRYYCIIDISSIMLCLWVQIWLAAGGLSFPGMCCVCVLPSHLFWTSGLWTSQPGSHQRKVTQDFSCASYYCSFLLSVVFVLFCFCLSCSRWSFLLCRWSSDLCAVQQTTYRIGNHRVFKRKIRTRLDLLSIILLLGTRYSIPGEARSEI